MNNLEVMLGLRYERTGKMADLEEAIRTARQAVNSTPPNHAGQALYLHSLGFMLLRRFERTGENADLEEAITTARQAVDSTPAGHADRAIYLNNLSTSLGLWYKRTGKMADLEEAITTARQAVNSTPPNHADWAAMLNNLGNMLESRYERTGEMADLEEAIKTARKAAISIPADHIDRAMCLNNLGSKLEKRYERTGDLADLEEAITMARQSVDSTPPNHAAWVGRLNSLGNRLLRRYERTGKMANLEEAITAARKAVNSTPDNHADQAIYSNSLGVILLRRFERTGGNADLEQAITTARQAVGLTPADHVDRAGRLNNLGNMLESRYERTQELHDLQNAADAFKDAWLALASVPFHRIAPSSRAIKVLHRLGQYDLAAQIAEQVIEFLPAVNPRFLHRRDRQYVLSMYSGIAADACAVFLRTRSAGTALQCLEKGRAVILGQLIDDRRDLSALQSAHPELASQFETLRNEVNSSVDTSDKDSGNAVAQRRRSAATELDQCIRSIQQLPGHTHFMSGLSEEEMQACATDGPIVAVNVSDLGSNAIIVSPDSITSLALPNLSAEVAKTWISRHWHSSDRSKRGENNAKYREYLEWLWAVCVRPILDAVYPRKNEQDGQLPRVWWVGSGLASSMPFHAAGVYSSWPGENALGRVVSSYAPSIKALAYSRTRRRRESAVQPKVLIATMPETPGLKRLPGVDVERERVAQVLGAYTTVEDIEKPASELVAKALTQCSIAHFACHGRSDSVDPSNSGLIFARRDENGGIVQDTLTVHTVSETNLQNVRLAYLSACSTAENKAARLADEAIHVATGFQVAGFPHVVGCLWPSVDEVCAEVAQSFYTQLTQQGGIDLGNRAIAVALHQSVLDVATRDWKRPLNWAQFVHYGA
jgi:tetratricopeptide (TPR) repeat protein